MIFGRQEIKQKLNYSSVASVRQESYKGLEQENGVPQCCGQGPAVHFPGD